MGPGGEPSLSPRPAVTPLTAGFLFAMMKAPDELRERESTGCTGLTASVKVLDRLPGTPFLNGKIEAKAMENRYYFDFLISVRHPGIAGYKHVVLTLASGTNDFRRPFQSALRWCEEQTEKTGLHYFLSTFGKSGSLDEVIAALTSQGLML